VLYFSDIPHKNSLVGLYLQQHNLILNFSMEVVGGAFNVASACGNGYMLPRTWHLTMMKQKFSTNVY